MATPIANLGVRAVGSGVLTANHNLLAGSHRKVLVYGGLEDAASRTLTGVTYDGMPMSLAAQGSAAGAAVNYGAIWYIDLPDSFPAGTYAVVATASGSTSDRCVLARALSGIAPGEPYQALSNGEGAPGDTTIENILSPALALPQWAFSYAISGNTGTFTAGGTQVQYDQFNTASTANQMADQEGGSGETSLSTTLTAGILNRLIRLCCVWTSYDASILPDPLQFGCP